MHFNFKLVGECRIEAILFAKQQHTIFLIDIYPFPQPNGNEIVDNIYALYKWCTLQDKI